MADLYDSFYSVTSSYTHSNPTSLNRYVSADENNNIKQLNHGPCDEHANINLTAIAEFLLMAIELTGNLFNVDKDRDLKNFHAQLQ
jgi:hypothetical protein